MKIFIPIIILIIYQVNFVNNDLLKKKVVTPPKNFLIDKNTMVYHLYENGRITSRSIEYLNNEKSIRFLTFDKNNEKNIILPYTIYIKTIVIVDYYLYSNYEQVIELVMSFLAFFESDANDAYQYPKFKYIVTGIIIAADEQVFNDFLSSYWSGWTLLTTQEWFNKFKIWLSKMTNKNKRNGIEFDFAFFITSAHDLQPETKYLKFLSSGNMECNSDNYPIIVSTHILKGVQYLNVHDMFLKHAMEKRWNYVCHQHVVKAGEKLSPTSDRPACTLPNLQQEFLNEAWPQCVIKKPEFLK